MSFFLDGLAILYMLFNGILGYSRGIVDEFGRLIGLVLSIIIATGYTIDASKLISEKIHIDSWLAIIIAFGGIFAIILIFSRLLTRLFKIALISKANIWINSFLGFLFGMLKGYCIITIFIWVLIILPLDSWTNIVEQNSRIFQITNNFRISPVNFFGWEDPLNHSENFIRDMVQP